MRIRFKANFYFLSILLCAPLQACPTHTNSLRQLDARDAARQAEQEGLSLPKAEVDGRVQTLNKKGAMSPIVDEITAKFVASSKGKKVLEVGTAYGKVALEALRVGNRDYTANDLEERHLKILAREIKENAPNQIDFVTLVPGDFPDGVSFADNQFDSILTARVIHFFAPDKIERTIRECLRILKPGGQIYVVALTPYVRRFQSFIPVYEKAKAEGKEFPGYVSSFKPYADPAVTTPKEMESLHDAAFTFFDREVLHRVFEQGGFEVIENKYFPLGYRSTIWEYDGREYVGLIARKPAANAQRKIFVQAGEGSFNHLALKELLGPQLTSFDVQFAGTPTEAMAHAADENGEAFVAISNMLVPGNLISATVDALMNFEIVSVQKMTTMKIEQCLLRHQNALAEKTPLTKIASHPAALAQVKRWSSMQKLEEIAEPIGTSKAAERLSRAELGLDVGVIGSKLAAEIYPNLVAVTCGIQDSSDNATTFALLSMRRRLSTVDKQRAEMDLHKVLGIK